MRKNVHNWIGNDKKECLNEPEKVISDLIDASAVWDTAVFVQSDRSVWGSGDNSRDPGDTVQTHSTLACVELVA